jgi:hypothetical protein
VPRCVEGQPGGGITQMPPPHTFCVSTSTQISLLQPERSRHGSPSALGPEHRGGWTVASQKVPAMQIRWLQSSPATPYAEHAPDLQYRPSPHSRDSRQAAPSGLLRTQRYDVSQ